jgi:hypothetical protein
MAFIVCADAGGEVAKARVSRKGEHKNVAMSNTKLRYAPSSGERSLSMNCVHYILNVEF